MSSKALKVVVEVKFRAVSCPGVRMPAKHDVYLSMCFMGQYRHSEDLPAVFPLLFNEKMTFEKIFRHALDPGDMTVMLEYETVRVELVQLIPPSGDILACFEEDARRFLFPEPKLVPSFSGIDREVLMTRASHFPGIAPRLEFSTKTTIIECSADEEIKVYPNATMRLVVKRNGKGSGRPRTSSPPRKQPQTLGRKQRGRKHSEREGITRSLSYTPRSQSLSPMRAGNTHHLAPGLADWDRPSTSQSPADGREELLGIFTQQHGPLAKDAGFLAWNQSICLDLPLSAVYLFTFGQAFILSEILSVWQKKPFYYWFVEEYLKVNPALQNQMISWTIQHRGCLIESKLRRPVLTENGKKSISEFEDCLRHQKLFADLPTGPQSLRLTGFWQKGLFLHDTLDRLWTGDWD